MVKVDDAYWLEKMKTFVDESEKTITTSAASLLSYVVFAFPIYTASSVFTIEYNDVSSWWAAVFALPYIALFWAYWLALTINAPVLNIVDPRVPHVIKSYYTQLINVKSKRLRKASRMAGVSMILLAAVVSSSFVVKHANFMKQPSTFEAALVNDGVDQFAAVSVHLPKAKSVLIKIKGASATIPEVEQSVFLDKQSDYNNSFKVKKDPLGYSISITWNDGTYKRSLEKTVMATP